MDYKPGDLFVGLIDFFSVLLPGALLSYAYLGLAHAHVMGKLLPDVDGDAKGLALFIFASYLTGHFVFLIGAKLDSLYDKYRDRFYLEDKPALDVVMKIKDKYLQVEPSYKISRRALKKLRSEGISTDILKKLKGMKRDAPKSGEQFITCITEAIGDGQIGNLRQQILKHTELTVINAFQWARANIELRAPGAAVEVHRLEADSKFFRSLMVVIVLISPVILINAAQSYGPVLMLVISVALLVLLALSFLRYVDQRRKSIKLAYYYLIALERVPQIEKSVPAIEPKPEWYAF